MIGIFAAHSTPPCVVEWAPTSPPASTHTPATDSFRENQSRSCLTNIASTRSTLAALFGASAAPSTSPRSIPPLPFSRERLKKGLYPRSAPRTLFGACAGSLTPRHLPLLPSEHLDLSGPYLAGPACRRPRIGEANRGPKGIGVADPVRSPEPKPFGKHLRVSRATCPVLKLLIDPV